MLPLESAFTSRGGFPLQGTLQRTKLSNTPSVPTVSPPPTPNPPSPPA